MYSMPTTKHKLLSVTPRAVGLASLAVSRVSLRVLAVSHSGLRARASRRPISTLSEVASPNMKQSARGVSCSGALRPMLVLFRVVYIPRRIRVAAPSQMVASTTIVVVTTATTTCFAVLQLQTALKGTRTLRRAHLRSPGSKAS